MATEYEGCSMIFASYFRSICIILSAVMLLFGMAALEMRLESLEDTLKQHQNIDKAFVALQAALPLKEIK